MDEMDNCVLRTIIDETMELQEETKKVSCADDVKIKTVNTDLLPTSQEAGMMYFWVPCVTLPTMIQACTMSPSSISQYSAAWSMCPLQKRENCI